LADLFKKEGKEIYESIIDYLRNSNRLEVADEFIIQELAMYYQVWFDSAKEVKKNGAVQVYKTGHSNVSGHFVAMNKSSQNIEKICHKLGIYEIMKSKLLQYGKMSYS
jgi:P27 family predicted phage terminase small subunit